MRLKKIQCDIIKSEIHRFLGPDVVIRLFGSRVDDAKRGGDIDLLIQHPGKIKNRIELECQLSARLYMKLGEQKIDVLLMDSSTLMQPIYEQALMHGIILK